MTIQLIASILSSLLFMIAIGWYARDVYKGRVQVAIVSVFMLSLINFSQVGSLISKELWYIVPFSLVAATVNLVICILGYKNAKFRITKLDIAVLIGALAGLIMWFATKDAAYNIYILTAVMLLSIVPIVTKTFKNPGSETKLPWQIVLASAVVLLFTITSAQPAAWLVQARQLLFSLLMNVALLKKTK